MKYHTPGGHNNQYSTGHSSHSLNPATSLYNSESFGNKQPSAGSVRQQEETPSKAPKHSIRPVTQPSKRSRQFSLRQRIKGKTSLITVLLLLSGGGGAVAIFSTPSLAVVQLSQILTQDLNDQLKAYSDRHVLLMRGKFSGSSSEPCKTSSSLLCRFTKPSDTQKDRLRSKNIALELDNNGRITRMTFPGVNSDPDVKVTSGRELQAKLQNDLTVRTGMQRAENPQFASMTDRSFRNTLRLLGTSKASRISGNTAEEREKSLNNVISESNELKTSDITPERDKDGKATGRYLDPDGNIMSQQQVNIINESAKVTESASKIKPANIAANIGKGVMATAALDVACTAYNASRMVGALSKVEKAKQAAQMATASLNVPASRSMAGVASDGEMEFVGNKINGIGGVVQPDEVVDESKVYDNGTATKPPMKQNTTQYATAFDSPGVKAALYGDVVPLDSRQARFSLAGGFSGTLDKLNTYIARVVNFGDPNPKEVSKKCHYIQNPLVRGTSIVAGIFVGIASFGTWQAAGVAASLAVSMALPYMISVAADIAAGDMFKNLSGEDFGSGAFVGTAAVMGTAAQHRGMKPLSADEAVAYTQAQQQSLAHYSEVERQLTRSQPFDIYNQYSFLGSLAATITPHITQSRTSIGTLAMSIGSFVPTILTTPVKASNPIERFQQCPDPMYKSLNIDADIYCNVRYGLSDKELAMDPIENARWMMTTGNVAIDDDTGVAIDNHQPWNYKKFMEECANRTVGWGENQDENQGDGSNCLSKANEPLNQHFRVFTMDVSVMDYMDGIDDITSSSGGDSGDVSSDGWAYPTTKDAAMTSGYKPSDRADHRGVDLAQPGSALGKPIYAARDGRVVASGPAEGFGNWIVIVHDVDGKELSTVYGHMRREDLLVKSGDTVKAGQLIARIGSEGWSTGPHLHFELWKGNRLQCSGDCSINPEPILQQTSRGSSASSGRDI
ncbi:MAG: M23 family metallopeptidase [Candidatus Saccharimonadales bacterium]